MGMTTDAIVGRGERPWATVWTLAALLLALTIAAIVAAPPARSQGEAGGRYTGVASCAGSTCHGRMEGDGTVVRQDELMRWQEPSTPGGAHSRAWAVLNTSRSQFIARNLGIGDPARGRAIVVDRQVGMCLLCHAGPFPEERFQGDIGPDLAGVGGRLSAGQIRLRIVDSRRVNPATTRPAYHRIDGRAQEAGAWSGRPLFTAQQVEDVVALLVSLRDRPAGAGRP